MLKSGHSSQSINEPTTINGTGMDQIRKIFSLHRADVFQPAKGIISQLERFSFQFPRTIPRSERNETDFVHACPRGERHAEY